MTPDDMGAEPGPATIATIARAVGVSAATVSKVLNGRADVGPETRARVEASLEQHRYRRRARRRPVGADHIELVFHRYNSAWGMQIVGGIDAVATPARVGVSVSQLGGAHSPSHRWLDDVLTRDPLGVVFVLCHPTPPQLRRLQRRQVPFVVVDTDSATSAPMPTVGSNNFNGGLFAARHLIELGHRRIAAITGPADVLCSRARLSGFLAAHEEAGLVVDPGLVRHGNFYVDAGFEHGMDLLGRAGAPTAVFAGSDLQAVGVLRAAHRLGLRVPDDVSVVGYDNLPVATWMDPALTTVNQPLGDMASTATRMLLDMARGAEVPTIRIDLVNDLVVRESTGPPAGR